MAIGARVLKVSKDKCVCLKWTSVGATLVSTDSAAMESMAINVTVIPAGVEPTVTSITTNVTLIRV